MAPIFDRSESLSNVDAAWLKMEDPANLMMITGILTFAEPLDFERLQATVQQRLLRFKRFRQRVTPARTRFGKPHWVKDSNFDLTYHLQRLSLPVNSGRPMLQGVVNTLMSKSLDYERPLWQIHLVENYGTGCALLVRIHHAIADGIALVQVLLSMTDQEPDATWSSIEQNAARRHHPIASLFQPALSAVRTTRKATQRLVHEGRETLNNPASLIDMAKLSAKGATALGRLVLRYPDPKTAFKGNLGIPKRAAWSDPIPLQEVKDIGKVVGGTVNDVILSAMTGALRRYLQGRGEPVEGLNFRAAVPVNLRPLEKALELGNKFGLVFLSLPVGIGDPIERIAELKRRMNALKGTPEPVVAFGVLHALGMSPAEIQDIFVNVIGTKATCVMTNVPGPRERLYLAGKAIRNIMFWVPQSGRVGLGVSLLSYAGEVRLGVATDEGLVSDPEKIIEGFQVEFESLKQLVQELGDATETASETDQAVEPGRCQGITKAGTRCKNRALAGSDYCRVHQRE